MFMYVPFMFLLRASWR